LAAFSIEPLLEEHQTSAVLSAYRLPDGCSYQALHDALKACGFIIYAGQGGLARKIFRVAVMGAVTESDVDRLIAAFRAFLRTERNES
jgi:2-aminoethylphosphonate-pyruvate transaminase